MNREAALNTKRGRLYQACTALCQRDTLAHTAHVSSNSHATSLTCPNLFVTGLLTSLGREVWFHEECMVLDRAGTHFCP